MRLLEGWETDPHDALTFRRLGAVVTFDDKRQAWLAKGPTSQAQTFRSLLHAVTWADLLVEPEELPPVREEEHPPYADPAALLRAIQAVLADDRMDDTGVVRAIEALLRVVP